MPQIERPSIPDTYRVDIIESELGWGSHVEETIYFDNEAEARKYAKDYNAKYNTEEKVPDWYMIAQYVGKVCVR